MTENELYFLSQQLEHLAGDLKNHSTAYEQDLHNRLTVAKRSVDIRLGGTMVAKSTGNAFKEFGEHALSQSSDITKYGKSLERVTDITGNAAKLFGKTGLAAGLAVKVVGELIESITEQWQATVKSHDLLSQYGITLGTNSDELLKNANAAQYSSKSLESLTGSVTKLGPRLMAIGSTTSDGANIFMRLTSVSNDVLNEFNNLGISQEQLTSLQTDYIAQQTSLGIPISKNVEQERAASLRYIDNVLKLAGMTGDSKQEIINELNAQRADVAFTMKIAQYQQRGDTVTVNRLQNAALLSKKFGDEYATGVRDIITNLTSTTTAGNMLIGLTNGQIIGWSDMLTQGKLTEDEYAKLIAQSVNARIKLYGGSQVLGAMGEEQSRSLGITTQAIEAAGLAANRGSSKQIENDLEEQKRTGGALKDTQNSQVTLERTAKIALDRLTRVAGKPLVGAFNTLADAAIGTVRIVAKTVRLFGGDLFDGVEEFISTMPEVRTEISTLTDLIQTSTENISKQELLVKRLKDKWTADVENAEVAAELSQAEEKLDKLKAEREANEKKRNSKERALGNMQAQQLSADDQRKINEASPASLAKVLAYIGMVESGNNYNKVQGGNQDLTNMTVSQVMELQSKLAATGGNSVTGVGKYQIKQNALIDLMRAGKITSKAKFSDTTQDILAAELIKRRGYDSYVTSGDADAFAEQLSPIWPNAVPSITANNSELLSGVRLNFKNALKAKKGGVFDGPMSGYPMELHGAEAVIPLTPHKTIPVEIPKSIIPVKVEKPIQPQPRKLIKKVPKPINTSTLFELIRLIGLEIEKNTQSQHHMLQQIRN